MPIHQGHFPFGRPALRSAFTAGRVAIESDAGEVVEERRNPRRSFAGHALETPWDKLHLAYFAGYAMWTYLTSSFAFASPGFQTEELPPWQDNPYGLRAQPDEAGRDASGRVEQDSLRVMDDQMGPLAELPGWLQAAGWGAVSASGLLIGAVGGYYTSLRHGTIARTMTFAAGVLLAVVAVDLVINARGAASVHWTVTGLLCGAAVFSSVNWLLSRRGAKHRKRCGECVEQPVEERQPGSGLAIAAGTFLDGVPEGVVLGLSVLSHGAPGLATVAAFFLGNIPEALSSSAGMRGAGRSARYVFGVWIGIALLISLAAAFAAHVLRGTVPAVRGTAEAFAAGAILALVSETMIPEAFHGSPQFNGLLLVVGFVALLILLALSH